MAEQKVDSLSGLDWLLIVLLLGSLGGFGWYWNQSSSGTIGIRQEFAAHWSNVLVINMLSTPELDEDAVMRGDALMLLALPSLHDDILPTNNLSNYIAIQNLRNLGMLDTVVSNVFGPEDPRFSKLRLEVYSDKGTKMTLIPLYRAGIRSIEFYQGRLLLRARLNNIETDQVVGTVVTSDGTTRTINLVPVHDHALQGQATLVND